MTSVLNLSHRAPQKRKGIAATPSVDAEVVCARVATDALLEAGTTVVKLCGAAVPRGGVRAATRAVGVRCRFGSSAAPGGAPRYLLRGTRFAICSGVVLVPAAS